MGEKKWYVLRTVGGKEKKAKDYLVKEIEKSGLQNQVSQVLVPVEKKFAIKNGKRVSVEKLLFPGYVLIEAELNAEIQYIIRNLVPGMSGFLTEKIEKKEEVEVKKTEGKKNSDDKTKTVTKVISERVPVPLRDDEVRRILGLHDEEIVSEGETEVDYAVGEAVKITDGPFSGFDGIVDEIVEDRSKIKVIVMIFGRKTLLELNFNQVTKE